MFKKTLLALSVATLAASASAGTIYSSVTDTAPTAAFLGGVGTAFGTNTAALGGDDDCLLAASALGVTANLNGKTNGVAAVAGVSDGDDAITVAGATPNALNVSSVIFTANDVCTVTIADTKSTTTSKSPIEAPEGTVTVTAAIVSGLGGYKEEDTLTLNFSGAKIDTVNTTAPTLTQRGGAALAILDITDTTIRFTVPTGETVTTTEILDLADVILDSSNLSTTTEVAIDLFATNTSGTKYDVTAATKVHGLVPQYSAVVDLALDGIINVSQDRQEIEDAAAVGAIDDTATVDTLHVDVDLDATVNLITPDEITFTLSGDFAWLDEAANSSDDGKAATAAELATYLGSYLKVDAAAAAAADSVSLNANMDKLTIVDTTGGTVGSDYLFMLKVPGKATGNPVLSEQTFTVSVAVDDGVASPNTNVMTAATDLAAGAWTLNGSVVTIPYMPFDDNTAVIMRHTNTGVQTGDIAVRYMLEGTSTAWESAGVVASSSRGVMNIRDAVMNAIKTKAGVTSGKVAIEITTNVPTDDVTVYAAYKVKDEQDRGFVGTFGKHGSAQ